LVGASAFVAQHSILSFANFVTALFAMIYKILPM